MPKSELERQLAESIKAIKAGTFKHATHDSLGERLRKMDEIDKPDALEVGPEALEAPDDEEW